MKKVALVFVTAVLLPSLALGWLALRSLRDQQFLVERQQAASWQGLAGALGQKWSMAEVGFVVSLDGEGRVLSPSLFSDAAARTFRLENDRFLCNKEAV